MDGDSALQPTKPNVISFTVLLSGSAYVQCRFRHVTELDDETPGQRIVSAVRMCEHKYAQRQAEATSV